MSTYGKWYRMNRKELEYYFGGCCFFCYSEDHLEFAHIFPTKINGKGRGSFTRLQDVKKNQLSYLLLCHDCHNKFDDVMRRVEWVHSFTN